MADDEVWGVIFTGEGEKAFIAGADIKELATLTPANAPFYARELQRVFFKVENMAKPNIAAINGFCLGGGCEFALCCHMRVASEKALIGQPEVHLGIIPGAMGNIRLPRLVGRGNAMELILGGKPIKANRALEIGLLNYVVDPDDLIGKCMEIFHEIFKNGRVAVGYAIQAINHGLDISAAEGGNLEADLFGLSFASEDSKEGIGAFLEKRKPDWQGK